jgi:hypothetical protein
MPADSGETQGASNLIKQLGESRAQGLEIPFDHAPDQTIIHGRIGMDQDIAEADYPREVRDGRCGSRVDPRQLVQRLADDLELSFAGGAQLLVRTVIGEGLAGGEAVDAVGRLAGVPDKLGRFSVHRG